MRHVEECWLGKESDYPSMKVKKVEQAGEREAEGGREGGSDETHTCAHTPAGQSQAPSFLRRRPQRQVCFHVASKIRRRRRHGDALQQSSREKTELADTPHGRANNRVRADD